MASTDINSLTLTERKVLYFYAYVGDNSPGAYAPEFMRAMGMNMREYSAAQSRLSKLGFLKQRGFTQAIAPSERVFAIADCLQRGGPIHDKINNLFNRHQMLRYMMRFVEAVRYARFEDTGKPDVRLTLDDIQYIMPLLDLKWVSRMLDLYEDLIYMRVVRLIVSAHESSDDPMSPELMDRVFGNVAGRGAQTVQDLADMRTLAEYLQYGAVPEITDPSKTRPWQLTLYAIRAAQHADYASAAKLFKHALTQLNQQQDIKNVYLVPIAAYYLVMTYVHLDTPETQKKLDQLIKKCDPAFTSLLLCDTLATAFRSEDHRPSDYQVSRLKRVQLTSGPAYAINHLGSMIEWYFSDGYVTGKLPVPRYAVLRHEMQAYTTLSDQERQQLSDSFGQPPMLTSIPRKTVWEWAMEDILNDVDAESPTDTAATTDNRAANRIIYTVDAYGDHVTPYLQTLLKSGTWSRPKTIPKKRFEAKDVEGMDATDINVASHMKHPYYSSVPEYPSIHKVAPYLVDSDKVYLHNDGDLLARHIEIKEGMPNIQVEAKNGVYQVKSNITLTNLNNRAGDKVVVRVNEVRYTVITLNERQRNIIRKLLKLDMVPVSAESQMRRFLTRLEDVVEVRSPLLDSKTMPTVEGCDQLVVKVMPDGETYDLSFYSMPLRGGSVYCRPGYGKTVVYDSVEDNQGVDKRVKRNLQAELDNYRDLIDMLEGDNGSNEYADAQVSEDDYQATIGIEGMLTLMSHARQNPQKITVEWPQGKELRLKQSSTKSWSVGLKANNGWFDIEGDFKIDEKTVLSMAEMLQLVANSKGRFIRLNEQDFIEIDQKLRRQLERLEALAVKNRNKLQISGFNAGLLDDSVLDGEIKIKADKSLGKLQQRIAESGKYTPEVPPALCAELRPYQVEGFQWMARLAQWGAGACLADDMGLGKTVQTIAFLLLKAAEGPAMIVAPASVVPNWMSELGRFAPTLKPVILNKAEDREKVVADAGPFDVVVSTYGILSTQNELLSQKKWTTVCLDEAHTIKNRETKMSHAVMQLQAEYRIILTGTPIQNHLGELWNLFRFINPGLLGSFETFKAKYVIPITVDNDRNRRKALQRIIRPFMLRRTKDEVMDDLPDKTEIVFPVELSPREMTMYEVMRQRAAKSLEDVEKVDINALAEITRLRRAACSMELVDEKWKDGSSKIQAFIDLVKDFQKEGNRMLVFSQFTSFLQLARKALDEAGEKYLYFDGSTTMSQRQRIVEEFRQGSCSIFLISLKAGGLGLNLTEANYVVHLDPWWNPAIEQQATDRAYRIGQNRNVTVYHLVAQNTIEEKIRRLHRTKRDLADSLLDGTSMAAQLSVKDVLDLISQAK